MPGRRPSTSADAGLLGRLLAGPIRILARRRDGARSRRAAIVVRVALEAGGRWAAGDPSAVRNVLRTARRSAAVLRLAETLLVGRTHLDARARDAMALVQHALDALPHDGSA